MNLDKQQPPKGPPPRRVLIVEDNDDSARVLAALIGHFGHEVQTVSNAASALNAVGEFDPQIALIDIGLPGVDGYELGRRIRALIDARATNVLLVALTGFGDDQARRRSREAGFDEHLLKPVPLDTLQELLARPLREQDNE